MIFEQFKSLFAARKLLFQASDHPNILVNAVYTGFDPTAKSLHIGNLVPILGLVLCGQNGIKPYSLIGSATTIIGDPTGRKHAKEALTLPEIHANASSISKQIEEVYSRGMELSKCESYKPITFVDNMSWFKDLKLIDFLTEMGRQVKVNSMLSRNCVQSRLNSEDGLTFCELSYQLMQGFDFFHLHQKFGVNVQIGGSDQWGNMISGTEFIGKKLKKDAAFITVPLLTTANGVKMGKSAGNGIWLDPSMTCVYDFYQYFMSLSDDDAIHILPLLNIYGDEAVSETSRMHFECPSSHHVQKFLAKSMTELIHGSELAEQAEKISETLFRHELIPNRSKFNFNILLDKTRFRKISRSVVAESEISALDFLKLIFSEYSNNQLKTMIKSGGLRFNYQKITDVHQKIRMEELADYLIVNYGKTSFYIIKLES